MPFLTEPEPERGAVLPVLPGISRIVAANPGPMTYYGTNTYLIDTPDGIAVLDPGSGRSSGACAGDPARHRRQGRADPGQPHASRPCRRGAGVEGRDRRADRRLSRQRPRHVRGRHQAGDGDNVRRHAGAAHAGPRVRSSVLRIAGKGRQQGAVQRRPRDVVVHQRGEPTGRQHGDYFSSLRILLERDDEVFLPGHGPQLPDPRALVREMLTIARCASAPSRQADRWAADTFTLMNTIYSQVHPRLRRAAERNVLAHLMKLEAEGKVMRDGELWRAM